MLNSATINSVATLVASVHKLGSLTLLEFGGNRLTSIAVDTLMAALKMPGREIRV